MTAVSTPPGDSLPLAGLFPAVTRADWREQVAAALRRSGRLAPDAPPGNVEAKLTSVTYEGIEIQPLYTAQDALPGDGTGVPGLTPDALGRGWEVRTRCAGPDPDQAREAVLGDLENGAGSVWLVLGPEGLPPGSLARVLDGVHLDLAPVVLEAGADAEAVAEEFLALAARRAPGRAGGNLGLDPIGFGARSGHPIDLAGLGRWAGRCLEQGVGLRAITVDATVHHDAGGSDADELGAAIATAVSYLRELGAAGLDPETAFGQVELRLAAGADQFLTIAKFRAARVLWARVAQVCGVENPGKGAGRARLHAVTSSAMMTRRDPSVNLLRTTLACFGAGVGGADSITVQPFDAALGLPDDLSRRIARNTPSLLTMESHLARVVDPAGGSWYVERLTADLAAAAWAWFTQIEAAGGMVAALESGTIARRLADTWARRSRNLARRKDPLTGVSEFPDLLQAPVTRPPHPAAVPTGPGALPNHRYAQAFEELRDAADERTERTGVRPAVFLATIGSLAAYTARASFAGSLFGAGGLATPEAGPGTDPGRIAAELTASGSKVACLASSDPLYAEHAAPVAAALKAAGAQLVLLAGRPGPRAEQDAAAGIDGYVYAGCDVLEVLAAVHRELEVTTR